MWISEGSPRCALPATMMKWPYTLKNPCSLIPAICHRPRDNDEFFADNFDMCLSAGLGATCRAARSPVSFVQTAKGWSCSH